MTEDFSAKKTRYKEKRTIKNLFSECNLEFTNENKHKLLDVLSTIPKKEEYVIRAYYGDGRTLSDIAKEMDFTREYIRYMRNMGLRRLRARLRKEKNVSETETYIITNKGNCYTVEAWKNGQKQTSNFEDMQKATEWIEKIKESGKECQ